MVRLLLFASILLAALCQPQLVKAQYQGSACANSKNAEILPVAGTFFYNPMPSKKEQFYNDWQNGVIWFNNNKHSDTVKLRYNSWLDEVLWLRTNDYRTAVVIKGNVTGFEFLAEAGKPALRFTKISETQNFVKQDIFVEVLAQGKTALFCYRKSVYNKGSNSFTFNNVYYLEHNGKREKVLMRKKPFYARFTETEADTLKQILKDNGLHFKNEYELAKGLELFNQR